jgi:phage tail-like protein
MGSTQEDGEQFYPSVGFHFSVKVVPDNSPSSGGSGTDIDNSFKEVSGITVNIKTEELKEGGENRYSYRVPGRTDYKNLVLKRGYISGKSELADWTIQRMESTLAEKVTTKHLMVSLLDSESEIITSWFFYNAWPVKSEISSLDAMENKYLVETMEFSYLYFEHMKQKG